jgi:hypothetical protein
MNDHWYNKENLIKHVSFENEVWLTRWSIIFQIFYDFFNIIYSDANITCKCLRINENSKGLHLDGVYQNHLRICGIYNRNPMTKLLYACVPNFMQSG